MSTKNTEPEELSPQDILLNEFDKYLDTCEAILKDNPFSEDAIPELSLADGNFKKVLENINWPDQSFEDYLKSLELLKHTDSDWDPEKILELLDEDDIIAEAEKTPGYAVIKLSSIAETDKLVEFVNKEIYPYNIGGKSAFTLD